MKKKSDSKPFWWTLGILFFIFISLYIAMQSGYYESAMSKKTTLTNEQIKKFEEDVRKGEAVDLNDYVVEEHVDYSNKTTNVAIKISKGVEKFMTKGIKGMFDFVKTMFT